MRLVDPDDTLTTDGAVDAILSKFKQPANKQEASEEEEHDGRAEDDSAGPADDDVTDTDADSEPEPQDDEPDEQAIIVRGKPMTAEEFDQNFVPKAEFTRKSMAVAEQSKAAQAQITERLSKLDTVIANAEAMAGKEPDWLELAKVKDPWEMQVLRAEWDAKAKQIKELNDSREQERARLSQEQTNNVINALMTGDYDKSWATQEGLVKGLSTIGEYAQKTYGFTPQQLLSSGIPQVFEIIDKARKWDEGQKILPKARQAVEKAPKIIQPGSKQTVNKAKAATNNEFDKRFRKTGNPRDLVNSLYAKYGTKRAK
jgi:hypothetical protein